MNPSRHLARRFVEALFNPTVPLKDVVSPQVVLHAWPWVSPGIAGLAQVRTTLAEIWHGQVVDIHATLQAADHVVMRVTEHGVHAGWWQGLEPTGRAVATSAIHIVRVADGRVVEHWRESDELARLHQVRADRRLP